MNLIVAKYKYEKYQNDSIQMLEDKHLLRLQNIRSGQTKK